MLYYYIHSKKNNRVSRIYEESEESHKGDSGELSLSLPMYYIGIEHWNADTARVEKGLDKHRVDIS